MTQPIKPHFILLGIITVCLSALLGMGLAKAIESPYGMVDPIDAKLEVGYTTYVENCSTCHVALPAAVLPSNTWQALITDPNHYGVTLTGITSFDQRLMLSYLQTYSRRHEGRGTTTPYRLQNSAYFQALHPDVALPQPLNLRSCIGCHQGANEQNYSLSNTEG